jgi:hypothetical protein
VPAVLSVVREEIRPAPEFTNVVQPHVTQNPGKLELDRSIEITDALRTPVGVDKLRELRICGCQSERAAPATLAIGAPCATQSDKLYSSQNTPVSAEGDCLCNVVVWRTQWAWQCFFSQFPGRRLCHHIPRQSGEYEHRRSSCQPLPCQYQLVLTP